MFCTSFMSKRRRTHHFEGKALFFFFLFQLLNWLCYYMKRKRRKKNISILKILRHHISELNIFSNEHSSMFNAMDSSIRSRYNSYVVLHANYIPYVYFHHFKSRNSYIFLFEHPTMTCGRGWFFLWKCWSNMIWTKKCATTTTIHSALFWTLKMVQFLFPTTYIILDMYAAIAMI